MKRWFLLFCLVSSVFAERTTLTGNWYGARQKAKDAGIDIASYYANEMLGNPVGGAAHGFANAGSFGLNISMDLDRIFGWKDALFFSSYVVRHGNNLSQEKIGNQFNVAQLYGTETYVVCELSLQKAFLDGKLLGRVGRLAGGNDFFASPLYQMYVNNAFCGNPTAIFANTLFSAYPIATWGAYVHVKPHPTLLMKFACYNNNENIFKDKYHGCYFPFKSTQGLMLISEWAYLASLWGLPGNYRLGGYYVTGRVPKLLGGSSIGNYGYYLLVDQMIYRGGVREITPFAALLFAEPSDKNQFPFFFTSGIVCKGPFPGRPDDNMVFGVAYGSYSSDVQPRETAETVVELNYWAWINQWVALTPDFQYIINPKGLGTIPNAFVFGLQVLINL